MGLFFGTEEAFTFLHIKGYVQDNGRVLTSTGSWLRNRATESDLSLYPFGPESILKSSATSSATSSAFVTNGSATVASGLYASSYYICERIGMKLLFS